MKLVTISDISTMNGVKINASDILLPREYYEDMLQAYPVVLNKVSKFFNEHKRAKAVIILGGLK